MMWIPFFPLFSFYFHTILFFFVFGFHALFSKRHFEKLMMYEYVRIMCHVGMRQIGRAAMSRDKNGAKKENEDHVSYFGMAWKEFICSTCYSNDKWKRALGFCSMARRRKCPFHYYYPGTISNPEHCLIWCSIQIFISRICVVSCRFAWMHECIYSGVSLIIYPISNGMTLFFSYSYYIEGLAV